MIELKIERRDVNVDLLDAQLREVGGDLFYGLSTQQSAVILYMSDAVSAELQKTLELIARQHDAAQLTARQEAEAARKNALEEGRTQPALDIIHYVDSPTEIQTLAAKMAWLEQEIRDMRGVS